MRAVLPPFRSAVGENLVLRSVENQEDVERVAAFDGIIHGPRAAAMARALMLDYPSARAEHWLFVENTAIGEIVASMALLPWQLRYEDVTLNAAEMAIVGTLEAYRGRGLIRALNRRFEELLRAGGYDLSHIQGIPYFYRQFGYEYAMPLETRWHCYPHQITRATTESDQSYRFRAATVDDVPLLLRFYGEAATDLDIHAARDTQMWRYLLGPSMVTETVADTWMIGDSAGAPIGYVRIAHHGFGEGLNVVETSRLAPAAAAAVLRHTSMLAADRQKPYIRLNLPANSMLVEVARQHGAYNAGGYAWQVRAPDPARLLRTLTPVLDRRLAASVFADLTGSLHLDFYRSAVDLPFVDGRLDWDGDAPPERAGSLRPLPELLAPLVLGYRGFDELDHAYHDVSADGAARSLAAVLFPPLEAFLYNVY